jgi:RNA polymerase sigma-70 factor (ECF subfamily)
VIDDAVTDALLALIKTPERYDPRQSSLLNYLARIGHNKLVDALREWARHRNLHFVGGTVELAQIEENNYREGPAQTDHSAEDTLPPEVEQLLYTILPDPTDRCVWDLICQGRTAVADFAEVLSITHLPAEQQRAEVKRHRDRVQKRVRRRQDAFRRLL